jgi:hypothetical protein
LDSEEGQEKLKKYKEDKKAKVKVGQCRLTVSKPMLKAHKVSALDTSIS